MKIHINALDDEEIILEWLKDLFNGDSFDLKTFTNGDDFRNAFSKETDMVITDARVPGYDLYDTLKYFRSISKGVYIIVITAYCSVDFLLPLFPLAVNEVIEKDTISQNWLNKIRDSVKSFLPSIINRTQLLEA